MIRSDVEVVDIDPEPWAEVHAAFQKARDRSWLYVLHDSGTVLKLHGHRAADVAATGLRRVDDLLATAKTLRLDTGAERVVLIDRTLVPDLVRDAVRHADPELTLQELRAKVASSYWTSPAIATDPRPPRDPWPTVRAALAGLAPLLHCLLVLEDSGTVKLAVLLRVEDGLVTKVSCIPHDHDDPEATALASVGSVHLLLRLEWSSFLDAIAAPDALDAIADLVETATTARGLGDSPALLRRAGRT